MKKLLTALSLAAALSGAAVAAQSMTSSEAAGPAPVMGTLKPGWGAARVLVPRRNATMIIEASTTTDALVLPRVKRHSGVSKPGFGVRR